MSCRVRVDGHEFEGDEEFCRQLFLVAVDVAKRSGPFAVSVDRMVMLSPQSEVSLEVPGGFAEETDYLGAYAKLVRPNASRGRSW